MKHSFDSKCRDLAEYFYPDWDAAALDDLAQDIQTLVEDATIKPPPKPEPRPGFCALCGHRMPAGEEMFRFHGYSGPCPTDPTSDGRTP